MTVEDNLAGRLVGEATRLEELRRARGAALLDGKPFDDGDIDQAEHRIDALRAAGDVAVARERAAAAEARAERRRMAEAALLKREEERVAAIARAEQAARDLVAALNVAFDSAAVERALFAELGKAQPLAITEAALTSRMGERLAAVLSGLASHPARLGHVTWHGTWRKAADSWAEEEAAAMEGAMTTS